MLGDNVLENIVWEDAGELPGQTRFDPKAVPHRYQLVLSIAR
jgi:hypothetical protein